MAQDKSRIEDNLQCTSMPASKQYNGFDYIPKGKTPFFFCDLELRKNHPVTMCLVYADKVLKWVKKAHFSTHQEVKNHGLIFRSKLTRGNTG